jgi:hypothetical protein
MGPQVPKGPMAIERQRINLWLLGILPDFPTGNLRKEAGLPSRPLAQDRGGVARAEVRSIVCFPRRI